MSANTRFAREVAETIRLRNELTGLLKRAGATSSVMSTSLKEYEARDTPPQRRAFVQAMSRTLSPIISSRKATEAEDVR